MEGVLQDPVVPAEWLMSNLQDPGIKVLDASWYMPHEQRDPLEEYKMAHIPGALFFDIDGIIDRTTNLPHMLPSEAAFSAAVSALGITNTDHVIVYDGKGLFTAPRVWWMFRVFGHEKVSVLDGGLPQWRACGFEVAGEVFEDEIRKAHSANKAVESIYQGKMIDQCSFQTNFQSSLLWTLDKIKQNRLVPTHELVDARLKGRFDGTDSEPRKGVRSGHIPGSKCIPFTELMDEAQKLLPAENIRTRFEHEGILLHHPIVVSCGSGVTACILALGLYRIGRPDVPVYDGSWTEWEAQPDAIVISSTST